MALNFPRTGGSDAVKSTAPFDHNAPYTVIQWHKNPTQVSDYQHAFHVGAGESYSGNTDLFGITNNGQQLMFGCAGGASDDFPAGGAYVAPSTTEFWIAMVREGSTVLKWYWGTDNTDGVLAYTSTANVSGRASADTMMIGGFASLPWAGDIALPRMWTRALSLSEIHNEVASSTVVDSTNIYSTPPFTGANLAAALIDSSAGGHNFTDLSSGSVTVTTMTADSLPDLGGGGVDTTAPILSSAILTATSATTSTGTITTDEVGPAWAVATTSATQPSAAQVKAGQDHTGTTAPSDTATLAIGANPAVFSFTGQTTSATYYIHVVQDDEADTPNTSDVESSAGEVIAAPTTVTVNTLVFTEGDNARMRMALAAGLRTGGCTLIWREKRIAQADYSGGDVFSDGTGSWDGGVWTSLFVTHGCDGTYDATGQRSVGATTPMYHEIAGMNSAAFGSAKDYIASNSSLGTQVSYPVQYGVWVERAVTINPNGSVLEHVNYVDFSDPTKVIRQNLATSDPVTPTNQYLDFGAPHWITDGSEDFSGEMTHRKVFSRALTESEIRQEFENYSDTPVVSDCWYSNYSPTASDISDKKPSGTAHPYVWNNGTATDSTAVFDLPGIEYVASVGGEIAFSGNSPLTLTKFYVGSASGSFVLSGTASFIGSHTYTVASSGNVSFTGTSPIVFGNGAVSYTLSPTGSITYSGTQTMAKGKSFDAAGVLSFSGTSFFVKQKVVVPTGQVSFSGTAPMTHNDVPPVTGHASQMTMTFVGN
jgi:hypothetical protein